MDTSRNKVGSHLFLVRLWLEHDAVDTVDAVVGADEVSSAWHGTVQHLLTGKAASFHDRLALTELLLEMMPAHNDGGDIAPSENGVTL